MQYSQGVKINSRRDLIKVILTLVIFAAIVVTVVGLSTRPKEAPTEKQVYDLLSSKGYTVEDQTERYTKNEKSTVIKNLTVEQDGLVFQYFVFENGNAAQNGYDNVTTELNKKRTITQDVETHGFRGNFIFRTLLANGEYYYLSRIGNTLVYATGDESLQNEINGIMNEL
jgi:hypothetical protein